MQRDQDGLDLLATNRKIYKPTREAKKNLQWHTIN